MADIMLIPTNCANWMIQEQCETLHLARRRRNWRGFWGKLNNAKPASFARTNGVIKWPTPHFLRCWCNRSHNFLGWHRQMTTGVGFTPHYDPPLFFFLSSINTAPATRLHKTPPKCSANPITVTPILKWGFEDKEHPIRGLYIIFF